MVALIQPNNSIPTHSIPTHRIPAHGSPASGPRQSRPYLVSLPGGDEGLEARVGSAPGRLVIVVSVIVALYAMLSIVQGGPPTIAEQTSAARDAASPAQIELGETIVVAEAGDTYWGIARSLVGAGDARSAVEQLVARNGGSDLLIGQEVIVPASIG